MKTDNRQTLGRDLAGLTTLIRIENQGVVDLGDGAAETLANLYVPGMGLLRMGFWRGQKVWDVWAVFAFAQWGCNHHDRWLAAFGGLEKPEPMVEECLCNASLSNDPRAWREVVEQNADYACNTLELSMVLSWTMGCLRDPDLAKKLMENSAATFGDDWSAWLIYADARSRLGMPDRDVRNALSRAQALAENGMSLGSVAEAWRILLGDEKGAESCCVSNDGNIECGLARPDLFEILANREKIVAEIRRSSKRPEDRFRMEQKAIAAAFLGDDFETAGVVISGLEGMPGAHESGVFVASLVYHLLDDAPRARELLRIASRLAQRREDLYDLAFEWFSHARDREIAMIFLDAARPGRNRISSPDDWLEWVDNVLDILNDKEMAAQGIREAENCARRELMNDSPMWDSIARAWLRIGKNDPEGAKRCRSKLD